MRFAIILIICAGIVTGAPFRALGLQEEDVPVVLPASDVEPALIGADGPEFTQVAAAQNLLRLSGAGIRACVLDEAIEVRNRAFGNCTAPGQPAPPECRIYFGYNGVADTTDPTPSNADQQHGTHVSSILAGNFLTTKLYDAAGVPLPYQRGVAYRALLGAIKAGDDFKDSVLTRCFKAVRDNRCDLVNMSFGGVTSNPDKMFKRQTYLLSKAGIITVAAAGNDGRENGGDALFVTGSPSSSALFSVAALNNTANPGATLQLSRAISTPTGQRKTLAAVLRADTRSSICEPSCKGIRLPADLVLMRSRPERDNCFPPASVTPTPELKGKAIVVEVSAECAEDVSWSDPDLFVPLAELKPAIVLLVLPEGRLPYEGYITTPQVPVMWLDPSDGAALVAALAEEASSAGTSALKLRAIPGATLMPVPDDLAGQPTEFSSWGPAPDLGLEPDIAAPGILYAALPYGSFQLWAGTSMASPYFSGVVALWLQHIRKTQDNPPTGDDLLAAARVAFLNTARPLRYKDTQLMWPPAKVGAGVVQAYNAMINNVTITPTQLLLRTDTGSSQRYTLTLVNKGSESITYTVEHKPAVGISFLRSWYAQAMDLQAPAAQVSLAVKTVTVPAGGTASLPVSFRIQDRLRELDNLVSGYITLTPVEQSGVEATSTGAAATSSTTQSAVLPRLVPLSVPYQGTTKDYSSIGKPDSLALFAQPMPELNPVAAAKLQGKPPVYICSGVVSDEVGTCSYKPGKVTIQNADSSGTAGMILFAAALVRPVANVSIQVWSADGSKLLGHMKSLGGCRASPPFQVAWLNYDQCDDAGYDWDTFETKYRRLGSKKYVRFLVGETYSFKLLIRPILSAADQLQGFRQPEKPHLITVPNTVEIVRKS